jgi:hypothetical protein
VPAAVKGTDHLARLGPLRVAYGDAVPIDDLVDLNPAEAARVATDRLMTSIELLESSL